MLVTPFAEQVAITYDNKATSSCKAGAITGDKMRQVFYDAEVPPHQ